MAGDFFVTHEIVLEFPCQTDRVQVCLLEANGKQQLVQRHEFGKLGIEPAWSLGEDGLPYFKGKREGYPFEKAVSVTVQLYGVVERLRDAEKFAEERAQEARQTRAYAGRLENENWEVIAENKSLKQQLEKLSENGGVMSNAGEQPLGPVSLPIFRVHLQSDDSEFGYRVIEVLSITNWGYEKTEPCGCCKEDRWRASPLLICRTESGIVPIPMWELLEEMGDGYYCEHGQEAEAAEQRKQTLERNRWLAKQQAEEEEQAKKSKRKTIRYKPAKAVTTRRASKKKTKTSPRRGK